MYYLQEELARAHRSELLDSARAAHRGQQAARARRIARAAEGTAPRSGRR